MNKMQQALLNMAMKRNPQLANNPQAQEIIAVLQNGDAARGEELASNICKSYGVTKEQAVAQSQQYFSGFKF